MDVDERMRRFVELTRLAKQDDAVRSIMEQWSISTGLSLQDMATQQPEEFDFMVEAIDDLLEQAPTETPPPWM